MSKPLNTLVYVKVKFLSSNNYIDNFCAVIYKLCDISLTVAGERRKYEI